MKKNLLLLGFFSVLATIVTNAQEAAFIFLKPIKLDSTVNTACDETSPVISSDGKVLYFSKVLCSINTGGETAGQDIWRSVMGSDGKWGKAINLRSPLNNKFENAPVAISPDGNSLYVTNIYRGTAKMSPGISVSTKVGDTTWSEAKAINFKNFIFKKNTFVSYAVSANGKHIFISRFKKDSVDLEDLFVSHLDEKGAWSDPVSLGDNVNSVGYETSPFLAEDDSTLYFSSNGWGGYGDADIFMSKRLDNTWKKWSRPVNLGNVINTKGFDGFFVTRSNGDCYYSSGDDAKSLGDIYYSKRIRAFNTLTVNLLNAKTKAPLAVATVTSAFRDGKEIISKTVVQNGMLQVKISKDPKKYFFVAHSEGYISAEQPLEIATMMINTDTAITMSLAPIEVGQTIRLNHIFFETGKAALLEESFIELDVLVEVLQDNSTMEILISGHTDNKGKPKANQTLSENRVKSVDQYLVSKGINTKRLTYKGFGSTKPVADNKTEEGRAKNRRVEFKILKK
jgi:outer membrane protein OmpA-like peptidoglycan-associated protein